MNKLGFFLVLIAAVSCLKDEQTDKIYSYVVSVFKGLAETDAATCAGVLTNHKDEVLEIVLAAVQEVKDGADVQTAISNAVIKLLAIDGFVSECNVLAMPAIYTKVTSKDGLVEVFQALIDNIDDVYSYGEQAKAAVDAKDYNLACEYAGKILAIALDFQVNRR